MASRRSQLWNYVLDPSLSGYLDFSPTHLSLLDVTLILIVLLLKSTWQVLRFGDSIASRSARQSSRNSNAGSSTVELPQLQLSMPLSIEDADIAKYLRAIDRRYTHGEMPPIHGPQLSLLLSVMTEPAMLLLLVHPGSPLQPLGAVNVRNTFTLLRPDLVSVASLVRTEQPGRPQWLVTAKLLRATRWVKRGVECDFEVVLERKDDGDARRTAVFRQVFTMLQFLKHQHPPSKPPPEKSGNSDPKVRETIISSASAPVHLEGSAPSKWSALCKDYNPIHTSALMARFFGMPGKIAHGNLVLARAIDVLQGSRGHALLDGSRQEAGRIVVEFKRPVVVPQRLEMVARMDVESTVHVRIFRRDKMVVEARIENI